MKTFGVFLVIVGFLALLCLGPEKTDLSIFETVQQNQSLWQPSVIMGIINFGAGLFFLGDKKNWL